MSMGCTLSDTTGIHTMPHPTTSAWQAQRDAGSATATAMQHQIGYDNSTKPDCQSMAANILMPYMLLHAAACQ
jgi:hypothetical protein